jgi:hypothetical protein
VLLGSPIWNVRAPMIMTTFVEGHDFTAKTVLPFVTYAVSGLGSVQRDYAAWWCSLGTQTCHPEPGLDIGPVLGDFFTADGQTVANPRTAASSPWR